MISRNILWTALAGALIMIAANVIAVLSGGFTTGTLILAGVGFLCFLSIAFAGESVNLAGYARFALNIFFFLGILIFIYLIIQNHHWRRDFTESRRYSLSPQGINYLQSIENQVQVTGFSVTPQLMRENLEQYGFYSDNLDISVRNPFQDFREARLIQEQFAMQVQPGDVFIQSGEKLKKIDDLEESVFINALVEVLRETDIVVYFMQGHGEGGLEEPDEDQKKKNVPTHFYLRRLMEERGIRVEIINPADAGEIPDDASAVICAGPKTDLLPVEKKALDEYLAAGGRFFLMLDPPTDPDRNFPLFKQLAEDYGIELRDDVIIDPNKVSMERFGLPVVPLVTQYARHPVTKDIPFDRYALFVPVARTVRPREPLPPELNFKVLMKTGKSSWSQPMRDLLRENIDTPAEEERAPQPLAAAVTFARPGTDEDTRLLIFGDSDIFTDTNIVYELPVYLFVNGISWLTQSEETVAIPPKVVESTPMTLTMAQKELIAVLLVITLPALVMFGGLGYTMWRRRSR